jgi:hypothetical protein
MLNALISVNNDLIAAEAKYHKTCFSSYVSKSNLKHREYIEKGETVYDAAFLDLAVEVGEGINQQKAYDMSSLLSRYRERLDDKGINAESYSKQRLKLRLQKHFGDNIVFHQHPDKSKPEIYSSTISVQDVLNAAAQNTDVRSGKKISDDAEQFVNVT